MKLSVIIPIYNVKDFLVPCLDSIFNQTLDDIQVIAVDDGSTDGSKQILEEYAKKEPRLTALYKKNGGQASARNLALQHVNGEYVGFVDSDDWIDKEMYQEMYELAIKKNADIVVCDMVDHFPNGKSTYYDASTFNNKFKSTPSACNKIFKFSFIKDVLFPHGLWYEDFCFTTKLLFQTDQIEKIHKGFYHCNCRSTSTMSNNNAEKNLDMITVLEELYIYAQKKGVYDKYKNDLDYMIIEHLIITSINRVIQMNNPNKINVIKEFLKFSKNKIPSLQKCEALKEFPTRRKIIAFLNYHNLYSISYRILKITSKL